MGAVAEAVARAVAESMAGAVAAAAAASSAAAAMAMAEAAGAAAGAAGAAGRAYRPTVQISHKRRLLARPLTLAVPAEYSQQCVMCTGHGLVALLVRRVGYPVQIRAILGPE